MRLDLAAHRGELGLDVGGRRQLGERRARLRLAPPPPRRGWRPGGSSPRSAPRRGRRCGWPRARRWRAARARRRPRAAGRASLARGSASASAAVRTSASAASTAVRLASTSARAACNSASMSASRFLPASRRAAPVGALAATEKPSQRHRSPSRETSRWPGLSSVRKARRVGAVDDADLREPAREFGRRLDVLASGFDALRQSRIGGLDRGAGPAHRRGGIDRRFEIVAERGAERGLVALRDGEVVDHRRPQVLGVDVEQLGERLRLGVEPLHAALGLGSGSRATSSACRAPECAASARSAAASASATAACAASAACDSAARSGRPAVLAPSCASSASTPASSASRRVRRSLWDRARPAAGCAAR